MTVMLCTSLDPRRKFYYFTKKEFPEDEINEAKTLYVIFYLIIVKARTWNMHYWLFLQQVYE